jgi:hypothetical protein
MEKARVKLQRRNSGYLSGKGNTLKRSFSIRQLRSIHYMRYIMAGVYCGKLGKDTEALLNFDRPVNFR